MVTVRNSGGIVRYLRAINIGHVFEVNSKIGNWITSIIFLMSSLRCSYCIRICSTILCLLCCCRTCNVYSRIYLKIFIGLKSQRNGGALGSPCFVGLRLASCPIETFESVGAVLSNVTELPEICLRQGGLITCHVCNS